MGSEEYTYGNMGEVVNTVKTIVIDDQIDKVHTYTSAFEYDSWNRIQKMTYPDGEVVDYEYYTNGELKAITGEKDGITYPYLVETGYNANGQTAYRILGNGSEQRYFYDKKDRLQLATLHIGSEKISENTYSYDKVDNITGINDNNTYYQAYTYDELNRLIGANGNDIDAVGVRSSYSMNMQYNNMSSPIVFEQSISSEGITTFKNNTYHYNSDIQPNAPVQIGQMYYRYDAAGNPTSILDANGIGKDLEWNADNQLRSIVDTKEGLSHSYAYNHTGERILKRYGTAQNAFYNGKDMGTLPDFGESYSAYASAYFVENNNGYTKHYYAGATRLVSKLGEGYYENNELVSTGKEEQEQYFYFQDHLGSSTYITDLNGDIAQYSAYTPYGEMFREYRNVTPYRFNGKELDTETGLYYYGARYYNPGTALWIGVDPLASKYPGVSPYVYCVGNPVKYVDPDGRRALPMEETYNGWTVKVDSWYGTRGSRLHKGIDFNYSGGGNSDLGSPIMSTHDGYAQIKITTTNAEGRMITITSKDNRYRTKYMHLSEIRVNDGDFVKEGDCIATMGGSGFGKESGYTAHLHYEVQEFINGEWKHINPSESNSINDLIDIQNYLPNHIENESLNIPENKIEIYNNNHNPIIRRSNNQRSFTLVDMWTNFINKLENTIMNQFY